MTTVIFCLLDGEMLNSMYAVLARKADTMSDHFILSSRQWIVVQECITSNLSFFSFFSFSYLLNNAYKTSF